MISGCQPKRPDIGDVVKLGTIEEHIQYQQFPIFNCQSQVSNSVVAIRSRTIEQSVELVFSGGLEIDPSIHQELLPFLSTIKVKVGAEYGITNSVSITDGGELHLNADPNTYPIYNIAWKEEWENGYVMVDYGEGAKQVPYRFQQFARPEIISIKYISCDYQGFETATALAIVSTPSPLPTASVPMPTATPTSSNIDIGISVCWPWGRVWICWP